MTKRIVMIVVSLWVFSLITIGLTGEAKSQTGKSIKIGVLSPMKFIDGFNLWRGAEMASDEINKAGGVRVAGVKKPIELIKIDTNEELSVTDAVMAAEKSITVDKVDFLIGMRRSEAALAMQEIVMKYKKVLIGVGALHPQQCTRVAEDYNKYKYYFLIAPNSANVGKVLLYHLEDVSKRVREELALEKAKLAILAEKIIWADPVVKAVETNAARIGFEVVGVWRPSSMGTDVTAELSAIKATGAHVIFQVASGPMGITLAKQWGELRIPATLVGGSSEAISRHYWEATGGYGAYTTAMTSFLRVKITDKTIPFWDAYVKRYNDFPTNTAGTYDAIYVLKEGIERAGTIDSDAVVSELEKTDYVGITGRIKFYARDHAFPHNVVFGPGFITWVVSQFSEGGKIGCIWPHGWEGVTYEGSEGYKIPPWVVEYWKKRK